MWDIGGCSPPWFPHYQLVGVGADAISCLHPNSSCSWTPVFPSFLSTAPSPQLCRSPIWEGIQSTPDCCLSPHPLGLQLVLWTRTHGVQIGGLVLLRGWGLRGSEEGLLSSKTLVKLSHLQTLSPSNPTSSPWMGDIMSTLSPRTEIWTSS